MIYKVRYITCITCYRWTDECFICIHIIIKIANIDDRVDYIVIYPCPLTGGRINPFNPVAGPPPTVAIVIEWGWLWTANTLRLWSAVTPSTCTMTTSVNGGPVLCSCTHRTRGLTAHWPEGTQYIIIIYIYMYIKQPLLWCRYTSRVHWTSRRHHHHRNRQNWRRT